MRFGTVTWLPLVAAASLMVISTGCKQSAITSSSYSQPASSGCPATVRTSSDLRSTMLSSFKQRYSHAPDGRKVRLTRFDHVGNVRTLNRQTLRIAEVETSATRYGAGPGPRYLAIFDSGGNFKSVLDVPATVIYCQDGLAFLRENQPGIESDWNMIDFSHGVGRESYYLIDYSGQAGLPFDRSLLNRRPQASSDRAMTPVS